jgi:hypothetical protein
MASNYVKNYQRQQQQRGANKKAEIDAVKKQKAQYQADRAASMNNPIAQANRQSDPLGAGIANMIHTQKMAGFDKQISDIENRKLSAKDKGIDTALDILGPSGLERMGDDRDVQEVLRRKKKIADEGIGTAEREQMRARMAQQMGQAQQMAGFQLGGALGGAKGAGVAAQQRSLAAQGLAARAGIESDIFLAQESAKRQGLESYASSLGEVKTFDIGQAAKERDIMFQSIMGYEQMESAEKAAQMQADAAAKRSGGCHIAGTKVLMADHTYKNIEDIKIGDEVMIGGKVMGCGSILSNETFYTLNDEVFTQSHLVFDPTTELYNRADESVHCTKYKEDVEMVVYPIFTENRCYVTSFVSGDFGMEEEYREIRNDLTYKMKGINYGKR